MKFNIITKLQSWMDSQNGATFLNYAYNWGASIVILGTLFKLTHMDGADIMLWIGLGTEVLVFFISGFDRPLWKEEKVSISPELHPMGQVANERNDKGDGMENVQHSPASPSLAKDDSKEDEQLTRKECAEIAMDSLHAFIEMYDIIAKMLIEQQKMMIEKQRQEEEQTLLMENFKELLMKIDTKIHTKKYFDIVRKMACES